MLILSTKIIFHIPLYAWNNGNPKAVNFKEIFSKKLEDNGFENWYVTAIKGHYKGRSFDEEILTLFCKPDDKQKAVSSFEETIDENRDEFGQESYAYECEDKLHILSHADFNDLNGAS